jgi:hypothetical protein
MNQNLHRGIQKPPELGENEQNQYSQTEEWRKATQ